MTNTGSLINHLAGNSRYPQPEPGMGATILMWTDRHAATIVAVSPSGKQVTIQEDKATRTDNLGMTDSGQNYTYEPNPNAPHRVYTLRKNGAWVLKGDPINGGQRIAIGHRDHYYDYSF